MGNILICDVCLYFLSGIKWRYLQCVATHSLLQYSLSQSSLSTATFVQPARTQMFGLEVAGVELRLEATFTTTSI